MVRFVQIAMIKMIR